MLTLRRKARDSISIGDDIEVTVLRIAGNVVTLGISAPRSVKVDRKEVRVGKSVTELRRADRSRGR